MQLTGSQIIAEVLLEQEVDTVFGYPGGSVLNIYDTLYKYSDKIQHILTAHEQGASHAADGYARTTGKTGVVISTSGPGATNLTTGLATAKMDSVPVVAITGNVNVDLLGRDSFQEVNTRLISQPVTKYSCIVKRIEDLAPMLREAFKIAISGRCGPVLVDVPKDITAQKYEYTPKPKQVPYESEQCAQSDIETAARMIAQAKKPLIYTGGGVVSANAGKYLRSIAKKADIPVCSSLMGMGGFDSEDELFIGMVGMHGAYKTGQAVKNCDLLLVTGARFSDRVAGDTKAFAADAKIIHIDIDPKEINKNVEIDFALVGHLKDILSRLDEVVENADHSAWKQQIERWGEEHKVTEKFDFPKPSPRHILETVNSLTGEDDIICTDVGQHQMWTAQVYKFKNPRTFATSGGLGTMGYGLGAAIGSQVGNPKKRTVLITGDGSFHMNLNEVTTLASYDLPIVVVVMNNSVLGMVRQWQKIFYENRFSHTDPRRKTDIAALAQAFGVRGMRITKDDEVESVLKEAFESNSPVIVDCQISPDANVLPMIPPGAAVDKIITEM